MAAQAASTMVPEQLLQARNRLIVHHALSAVAKLGITDLLERGLHSWNSHRELNPALYPSAHAVW